MLWICLLMLGFTYIDTNYYLLRSFLYLTGLMYLIKVHIGMNTWGRWEWSNWVFWQGSFKDISSDDFLEARGISSAQKYLSNNIIWIQKETGRHVGFLPAQAAANHLQRIIILRKTWNICSWDVHRQFWHAQWLMLVIRRMHPGNKGGVVFGPQTCHALKIAT